MAVATGSGGSLTGTGRVADMMRRLERRLEQASLAPQQRASVLAAVGDPLDRRARAFGDEHFETLHPARTLLILLDDCDVADAVVLEAAAAIDSEHAALRAPSSSPLAQLVPLPDHVGDSLLEDLVSADETVRLIALAERLDHARHLHLRERSDWVDFHHGIGVVYAPVAARTHARLARRFDWWWHTFRRRFLQAPDTR